MALHPVGPSARGVGGPNRPWPVLLGGLAATAAGMVLYAVGTREALAGWWPYLAPVRVLLIGGGLIAAGVAVARRLQSARPEFEERVESALVLLLAAVAVGAAYLGMGDADSLQMLLLVMGLVAGAGVWLVLLPAKARYVVISLLLLLHFGSITTSVLTVPPPRSAAPWLMVNVWSYFFRPYSSFMYLNNAYHFYSPEPGPPTLVWFHVQYGDGTYRWIKLPSPDDPLPLHYQRMLALTESANVINPNLPPDFAERARRRQLAGKVEFHPEIPLPADLPPNLQYQEPEEYSKVMVASYVRFVARRYPHPDSPPGDPAAEITGIKAYRLIHSIINASDLAAGVSPNSKTLDLPYFQGEFNKDGTLKEPEDPFLYWIVPILSQPKQAPGVFRGPAGRAAGLDVIDCLEIHAGHKSPASEEVLLP